MKTKDLLLTMMCLPYSECLDYKFPSAYGIFILWLPSLYSRKKQELESGGVCVVRD